MDLKLAFTTALLMALATVLVRAVFGKRVAWVIGFVGTLSVLVPLLLIIVLGIMGMLESDGIGAGEAASNTVSAVFAYMVENLPDLVISAIAGAVVGFCLGAIKKVTPKKVRAKVRHSVRL
jgi:hypothetical protein